MVQAIHLFVSAALVAAALSSSPITPLRETVSFDYGWKFTHDDLASEAPSCQYTRDLTNLTCDITGTSLQYTPDGRVWTPDCEQACTTRSDCTAWAWVKSDWTASCYISFAPDSALSCTASSDESNVAPSKASQVIKGGAGRTCFNPKTFSYAQPSFDDKSWSLLDLPHDSVVNSTYSSLEDNAHGSFVRRVAWYRKHFTLPQDWSKDSSSSVLVEFDAIFHVADVWVNGYHYGTYHSGYLPVVLTLNPAHVRFGNTDAPNVIAVRADPTFGSGHWYEGGGIYRHTRLVKVNKLHIAPDGLFSSPEISVSNASFAPIVTVVNDNADHKLDHVFAHFSLLALPYPGSPFPAPELIAETKSAIGSVGANEKLDLEGQSVPLPSSLPLWSTDKPLLYRLTAEILVGDQVVDSQWTLVSFRSTHWDANKGFYVNGQHLHLHGFCHHEDFAGIGVAISDRINLYRAQALRAVGGNSWRMSHNPYKPSTYDLLDRLGIVVWDEARDYAAWYKDDMAAMVRRDRNHPSVAIWSFCNEIECHQDVNDNTTGVLFRDAALALDPTRPLSYNSVPESSDIVDDTVDVHGFSHMQTSVFTQYHQSHPQRPIVSSECCSCETQRGEHFGTGGDVYHPAFDGDCLMREVPWSDDLNYNGGTMGVWTLFDYFGEPDGWPHISSSFGQFDLAGIPKAHAYWYRAWWACQDGSCRVAHIVEEWDKTGSLPPSIHVIANAASIELVRDDGKSLGEQKIPFRGYGKFDVSGDDLQHALTALAKDASGTVVAKHTYAPSSGVAAGVKLTLDAPHVNTGTGTHLVLDGHDTALVRATIVDKDGLTVANSSLTVNFRVIQGPGRIVGVGNGNPSSQEPNQIDSRSAYHGLTRAVVQAAVDCVSAGQERMNEIDVHGNIRTPTCAHKDAPEGDIVLEASVEGLDSSAQIVIPTSVSPLYDPLNIAAFRPDVSLFLDHFHN